MKRNTGGLGNEAFTSNPTVSSKNRLAVEKLETDFSPGNGMSS